MAQEYQRQRGQAVSLAGQLIREGLTADQAVSSVAQLFPEAPAPWAAGVVRSALALLRYARRPTPPPSGPPPVVTIYAVQEVADLYERSGPQGGLTSYITIRVDVPVTSTRGEILEHLHWAGVDAARAARTEPAGEPQITPPLMFHLPRGRE